jgi:hypothetical protein
MKHGAARNPAQAQAITREMQAWVSAQLVSGHSTEDIFHALTEAGWQAGTANQALGLPEVGSASLPALAVPVVKADVSGRHG